MYLTECELYNGRYLQFNTDIPCIYLMKMFNPLLDSPEFMFQKAK